MSISPVTATSQAAAASGTSALSASSLQDMSQTFLQLLVAQIQNQDPTNPMDNAQMTSQLAQLSTVDGINQLNSTVSSLASSLSQASGLQAAGLVGKGVLAPGNTLNLANGQSQGGVSLAQPAGDLQVTIKDAAGNVVNTIDLGAQPAGVVPFQWNGTTSAGGSAPSGSYTFTAAAAQGGSAVQATPLAYATVQSVTLGASGATLNTDALGAVSLANVDQIF
ncbi:MAG: flagellar hook assembly protein FlgD [Betaproteobacteria bacterium]|nr:flagellar hook assembly protein FlgD [Betaproteobacteria bacterium]